MGGLIIIALTFIINSRDYLGAGINIIEHCITGSEIVPSFFIGATFGAVFGPLLGLEVSFVAAIGMLSVFCGVTNCPVSMLLIGFELFGFSAVTLFLIAIAVSYLVSGRESLYSTQKIVDPKFGVDFKEENNESSNI